ncbi:MAG: polysaccharide deacetylase [Rubrivivax sp.]|nr:MAG: polysaccharide deacetylase [Rubrivivax sp.]
MRFKRWLPLLGLVLGCAAAAAPTREIAVTFDDLPAVDGGLSQHGEVTRKLLASLKAHDVPALGFVNEGKLFVRGEMDARTALLRQWLDAGHLLGNHTFSHIDITQVPVEAYVEDVIRGETVTRMLLAEQGEKLRYFRHTQLRTGPTDAYRSQLNGALAARGYVTAPVTIDNNDYLFNRAYTRAGERHDTATRKKLVAEYLAYMESVIAHFETLSDSFLGRPMKHTLLLHANDINADHFGTLAQMLKRRGYRFITLDDALTDPAYQLPEAQSKRGISWLHRWMLAEGQPMQEEPTEAEWVRALAR